MIARIVPVFALLACSVSAQAATVGAVLERTVLRHLYGRPLETLLATWGLSLMLQQTYRSVFGPREVGVELPPWMMGSLQLSETIEVQINGLFVMTLTVVITTIVGVLMYKARWGKQVRAVVQNRAMAGAVGIDTEKVDRLTFGIGWGLGGFCPGPAIVWLGTGDGKTALFVLAMAGGMALYELSQKRAASRD